MFCLLFKAVTYGQQQVERDPNDTDKHVRSRYTITLMEDSEVIDHYWTGLLVLSGKFQFREPSKKLDETRHNSPGLSQVYTCSTSIKFCFLGKKLQLLPLVHSCNLRTNASLTVSRTTNASILSLLGTQPCSLNNTSSFAPCLWH